MKHKWLLFLIMPVSAFADQLLISNVSNGCFNSLNEHTFLIATFTRSQYQCNAGYYVPANNDGCVVCPDVYDCNGGSFYFNEDIDQGNKFKIQVTENIRNGCKTDFLKALNNVANITATFTPNEHNCSAGYYLPANVDECRKCLANSYCPGGILYFNENTPQGITACPNNQTSLAGSSSVDQCKTVTLNWISNGETYETTTCTINGIITLPEPPTRPGYVFNGWRVETNE